MSKRRMIFELTVIKEVLVGVCVSVSGGSVVLDGVVRY
jgi:hypothetical protein